MHPSAAVQNIIRVAEANVGHVINYLREQGVENQTGGFFSLTLACTTRKKETFVLPSFINVPIGEMSLSDWEQSAKYALEKNDRLRANDDKNHESSAQSAEPENKRWGGAIRAIVSEDDIKLMFAPEDDVESVIAYLSLSGLRENDDEASVLLTARELKWDCEADLIIAISGNDVARALLS